MPGVGALVLAAGGSSRLGQPKQFLPFEGTTLLRRIIHAARTANCSPIVVVAGDADEQIRAEVADSATVVRNENWQSGIGSSIRCGLNTLESDPSNLDAVIILACDQPFVSPATIRSLMAEYRRTARGIVASQYAGTTGIPALFSRAFFPALQALPDATGAKSIIEFNPDDVVRVSFPEGAIDVDTPADYNALGRDGSSTGPASISEG